MRLSDFIRRNRPAIIEEWRDFARAVRPAAGLSDLQLTNHIDQILSFIADDIETAQTAKEQFDKSWGRQEDRSPGVDTAAQTHAAMRHSDGFDMVEMASEYRALRASVTKLWTRAHKTLNAEDIDDLGRFNEAIDQALAESVVRFAQSVDKAKDLLLGVLGHDIRSPVGAIDMAATLVPQTGPVNDQQRQLLEQVGISAERVQGIVADLIDLAKSGDGRSMPLKKGKCSLLTLSERIVGEMRIRHGDREFVLAIATDVEGRWDGTRLGQLLSNLLSNAVQYGAPDTPVVLHVMQTAETATIAVTNRGRPIPPGHLDAVFKAFSRGPSDDPERQVPTSNLGLGLFISREIAEAHGGSISVTSSEEHGTTFTVRLPK